jgi:hypothetical protein
MEAPREAESFESLKAVHHEGGGFMQGISENCLNKMWRGARRKAISLTIIIAILVTAGLLAQRALAAPPDATIEYQPMTSDGLAAGYPFECWVVFDKSSDPAVPGYALPAGATFRFTFPQAFTPQPTGPRPAVVLLYGWPQMAMSVPFTVGLDPENPRTIVLKLTEPIQAGPPERPGLKSIHLRWGPLNPAQAGDYPITIQLTDAGALSGTTQAIAHITAKPVPNIAAYNQLHEGRNENWQHLKTGQAAALPIDLLVTLPDKARSSISLRPATEGNIDILSDMVPIGTITRRGVPVTLKPQSFGPGYARLGILRYYVTAGSEPGIAQIEAELRGGTHYTINIIVE